MHGASLYSLTLNAPYIDSTFISFSTFLRTSGTKLFDSSLQTVRVGKELLKNMPPCPDQEDRGLDNNT